MLSNKTKKFNGINIRKERNGKIKIDQEDKVAKLQTQLEQKGFTIHREMAQYIRMKCRTDFPPQMCN